MAEVSRALTTKDVAGGDRSREAALFSVFLIFLLPVSWEGSSANYSFLLLPLLFVLTTGRVLLPPRQFLAVIFIYAGIFVISILYYADGTSDAPRRLSSFIIFMSMFSYIFMKVDGQMIRSFKLALMSSASFFATVSIVNFFWLGGADLGFEAKDEVGGQRYGFVYVMALWIALLDRPVRPGLRLVQLVVALVLLVGLSLSFSRASVVALCASVLLYLIATLFRKSTSRRTPSRLLVPLLVLAIGAAFLGMYFPVAVEFFQVRLFDFVLDSDALANALENPETSEGTRLLIWSSVIEYVWLHPVTGSGYLGVWMLDIFGDRSGSAHNQYIDVLFRVGVIGFSVYVLLLVRLARFLSRSHEAFFWGFVGVLTYGLFHETFKESHGGFVLAFLFGMMAHQTRTQALLFRRERRETLVQGHLTVPPESLKTIKNRIEERPISPL